MSPHALENRIAHSVEQILHPYLTQFHSHKIKVGYGEIEVKGKVDEKDRDDILIFRVLINHDKKQIGIPNVFMPKFMQNHGIGKRLIADTYHIAESSNYSLFVIDLVSSFYRRLIQRGAVSIEENDIVMITKDTDLSHKHA